MNQPQWQFWIVRGGTFTDIVAQHPDGSLLNHKLLRIDRYKNRVIYVIKFSILLFKKEK